MAEREQEHEWWGNQLSFLLECCIKNCILCY